MNESGKNSIVLAVLAIVAFAAACGSVGFYYFEKPIAPDLTLWDSFWWAMVTITTIGYGDIFPKTVGGRLIALFLMFMGIGALSFSTAAIASYFIRNDGLQRMRVRRLRGHVVIGGLGRKGMLLTRAFLARGRNVVVVEEDENNESIFMARELGAEVLIGDAREPEMLAKSGLERAQDLIALCGDDSKNAEIAARARELLHNRHTHDPLICSVHIVNPELWHLLREWEISGGSGFRLQFFNLVDTAARALLDEYPALACKAGAVPHVLVVGVGRLGQSLLLHIARSWRDLNRSKPPAERQKLPVTLVDRDVKMVLELLHQRHPELEHVCEFNAFALDTVEPEFHRGKFLFDADGKCVISTAYVCLADDAETMSAALAIHGRLRHVQIPVIATMTQESGLTTLLQGAGQSQSRFENLHAVGLLERACQPDLVTGGIPELLARALHDRYLEEQTAAGVSAAQNPSLVSWDKLPSEVRESNRAQALHMGEKLRAIGCDIAPLVDWNAATHSFSRAEVELMARMEHERWMTERQQAGWKFGPRDPAAKTNPNLIPWDQLTEDVRSFNCEVVREIPASLAFAGFQIYRLADSSPQPTHTK